MKRRAAKRIRAAAALSDLSGVNTMLNHEKIRKKRYTISIGLNDKDTMAQKIQTEKILRLVNTCCKSYGLAFSSVLQDGGYVHEDNSYVLEKSVCLVFIDPDEAAIQEIGQDLCAFLNQESVLVTVDEVECYYISESIDR